MSEKFINELLNVIEVSIFNKINTITIGRIESIDYTSTPVKAVVTPVINKSGVKYAPISDVLILINQTKKAIIKLPFEKGDYGLLLFCQFPTNTWIDKGGIVDPDDIRRYSITDAVFIPGLLSSVDNSECSINKDDLEIHYKDSSFIIKKNGDINLKSGQSTIEMTSNKISFNGDNLTVSV